MTIGKETKPGFALAVILAAVFLGVGQSLLDIHASDFSEYEAPFASPLASALTAPAAAVILPAAVLFLAFLIIRLPSRKAADAVLVACVAYATLLYGLRIYYLMSGEFFLDDAGAVALFVALLVFIGFLKRFFFYFFAVYSLLALLLSAWFSFDYYSYLRRAEPIAFAYDGYTLDRATAPIFVFIFDELSGYLIRNEQGGVDGELFPELNSFAAGATWFVNATTPHTSTVTTLASVVSGQDVFDVCSRNASLPARAIDDAIFARRCGAYHVFTHPAIAPGVNIAGSKIGAERVMFVKRTVDKDRTSRAQRGDGAATRAQRRSERTSRLLPYLQRLAETYAQGSRNPVLANLIFGSLLEFGSRLRRDAETQSAATTSNAGGTASPGGNDRSKQAHAARERPDRDTKLEDDRSGALAEALDLSGFERCVRRANAAAAEFRDFYRGFDPRARPVNLIITHLTHVPYCVDAQGPVELLYPNPRLRRSDGAMAIYNHVSGTCGLDEVAQAVKRAQINQTRLAMKLFGEAIERIRSLGVFDESLIIAMSDHGRGFLGPSAGRHNDAARSEEDQMDNRMMNAAIPLFVKFPGQREARRDLRLAQPKDIGATLMDVLGVTPPWSVQGQSLLGPEWVEPALPLRFLQNVRTPGGDTMEFSAIELPEKHFSAFKHKLNEVNTIKSRWIGSKVEELPLHAEQSGQLEYLKVERSLPADGDAEYVLTVGGHSVLDAASAAAPRTYIAVNGTIVTAVKPCLRFEDADHKWASIAGGWVTALPAAALQSRELEIRAFSPAGVRERTFHELARPIHVNLTADQFSRLQPLSPHEAGAGKR